METVKKVGFVGLGLIGGSIAKAVRKYYPDWLITAFDEDRRTLDTALRECVIDIASDSVDENFSDCRYIFLCAPVAANNDRLKSVADTANEDCIITDVGSVKKPIHLNAAHLNIEDRFIGGHPMAGSEKSGFKNSKALLIENAYYIVTPCEKTPKEKTDEYIRFVESLKAIPVILSCEEHDYIAGVISHLPHIIAATLVNFVKDHDSSGEIMKRLAAGGFKDITRIASSSPVMWQNICESNAANISGILSEYIKSLQNVRNKLDTGDGEGIYDLFESSGNYRDSIPEGGAGSMKRTYAIYCDIIDEAGSIAAIATILAANGISMKNIGIVHNREFEEGVLRIEFYDRDAQNGAAGVLRKYKYTVYPI